MGFDLGQAIQNNSHQNQQGSSTIELGELRIDTQDDRYSRQNGNTGKKQRICEGDSNQDIVNVISGATTGLHTGNERAVPLQVLGHLVGIHRKRRVEIGKDNNQNTQ